MKLIPLLVFGALLVGCERASDRALVAEYHQAIIDYQEGKRIETVPYSLELERALERLHEAGEISFLRVEFHDIPQSPETVKEGIAALQDYYTYIIDATFPVVTDGDPLTLEMYYYPGYEAEAKAAVAAIKTTGQQIDDGNAEKPLGEERAQ